MLVPEKTPEKYLTPECLNASGTGEISAKRHFASRVDRNFAKVAAKFRLI